MDIEQQVMQWRNKRLSQQHYRSFLSWYRQKPAPNKLSFIIGLCIGFSFGLLLTKVIWQAIR